MTTKNDKIQNGRGHQSTSNFSKLEIFFKWKFFFDATSSFQKNEFKTFFSRFEVFQFSRLVPCMAMHGHAWSMHGHAWDVTFYMDHAIPCMGSHGTSVRARLKLFCNPQSCQNRRVTETLS